MDARDPVVRGTSSLILKVISAASRSLISTSFTEPTVTPATRTSSPAWSRLAEVNWALYSVSVPNAKEPMIAVRVPVTIRLIRTKIPSLIPATIVCVFRLRVVIGGCPRTSTRARCRS